MRYLTERQIRLIHAAEVDHTGGSHGVRDENLLSSAAELPKQIAFGKELYPDIFAKAAVLLRSIIANHPFFDGNKRAAMVVAATFLSINGHEINAPVGQIEKFALRVIEDKLDIAEIAEWLETNSKKI